MCTSLVQVAFIVILVAGAALTIVSLATPAWKEFHGNDTIIDSGQKVVKNYTNYKAMIGLFTTACGGDGEWKKCEDYFYSSPDWKKASMACLIIALASCAAAFVWSCVACFMCCCKSCLTPPLPILAGLACVLDIIGITIYAVKSGEEFGDMPTNLNQLQNKSTFGYSFWVGIGAIATLFVDTLVGIVLVKTAKVSPI